MNILFHVHQMNIGGAERQLIYLVRCLVSKGVNVHVITLYEGGDFWDELNGIDGCMVFCVNQKYKFDYTVIYKLSKYIRVHNIDIIQGWMAPCNSFSALASFFAGKKPALMAIRASNIIDYGVGSRMYEYLDKVVANWITAKVIYNSYLGCENYTNWGMPVNKCQVIANGIEYVGDIVFKTPLSHPVLKIGMLSRIDPMKDHDTMFKALEIFVRDHMSVELHVYGEGNAKWSAHLKQAIEKLGIGHYVHWHGWADNVWNVYNKIDVFVSSSSNGEGMSNTIMEAMIAGRVVVSTDVGDAARMLKFNSNDPCGWVINPGDDEALANVLKNIWEDRKSAVAVAEKARIVATEEYSVTKMADQYYQCYNEILSEGVV